jgi:hypothetical protein
MAAKGHFSRPDIKAMRERMKRLQQTGSVDSAKQKPGTMAWKLLGAGGVLAVISMTVLTAIAPGGIPLRIPGLDPQLNELLFASKPQGVFGDPVLDLWYAGTMRGFALCLVAGFLPFCTFFWLRLRDVSRANLYVAFWGMTVGLPCTYFFLKDFFWPILQDIMAMVS